MKGGFLGVPETARCSISRRPPRDQWGWTGWLQRLEREPWKKPDERNGETRDQELTSRARIAIARA